MNVAKLRAMAEITKALQKIDPASDNKIYFDQLSDILNIAPEAVRELMIKTLDGTIDQKDVDKMVQKVITEKAKEFE